MDTVITTIRLPVELHEALRQRAFAERRALADIIREAVVAWLSREPDEGPLPPLEEDPLWNLVGSVPGGPEDEAERHDDYLYADRVAESSARPRGPEAGRAKKTPTRRRAKKR